MAAAGNRDGYTSFVGIGWSFPPRFTAGTAAAGAAGGVDMTTDEADIDNSLRILFGTSPGERPFRDSYGLDLGDSLFEPLTTTLRTLLLERVRTALLIYEPRIEVTELDIAGDADEGVLRLSIEYRVRSTNSRFNLVYPFYRTDASEVRTSVAAARSEPGTNP